MLGEEGRKQYWNYAGTFGRSKNRKLLLVVEEHIIIFKTFQKKKKTFSAFAKTLVRYIKCVCAKIMWYTWQGMIFRTQFLFGMRWGHNKGFPGGSEGKESACNAGNPGLITGSGRSLRKGNGYPLQDSCLENSVDKGAWKELDMTERLTLWLLGHKSYFHLCGCFEQGTQWNLFVRSATSSL